MLPGELLSSTIASWAASHGPIFEVFIIPKLAPLGIVINDVNLVKEMGMCRELANRDNNDTPLRRVFSPKMEGILSQMWTPVWKDLRKFTMTALSQLGFGKAAMEAQIVEEADELIDAMLETDGKPFEPVNLIRLAVSNVITRLVFGVRAEIGRTSFIHDRLGVVMNGFLYLMTQPWYLMCPALMDYYQTSSLREIIRANADVRKHVEGAIAEHERTLGKEEEDPRDFIDAVIIERRRRPNDPALSTSQIQSTVIDIFAGGTDTTMAALNWVFAWLLHYPDVKAKLKKEINEVIGFSGSPTVASMSRCNYVLAFIDEMLRCSSIADFTFFHRATKPVVHFGGHIITDDKVVIGNLWACNNDPNVWDKPQEFRPERHLDSHGRYQKNENLIPFGIGTRRCVGEKLSRLEMFIFIVRFLQRLDFRVCPGEELPNMFGVKPFMRHPGVYRIVAQPSVLTD